MKQYIISIFCIITLGCYDSKTMNNQGLSSHSHDTVIQLTDTMLEVFEHFDTLTVRGKCAIVYSPDSLKIKKLKNETDEKSFYTVADDNLWYIAESRNYLNTKGLKVVDTDMKIIEFINNKGEKTIFNTDKLQFSWGLLLFDGVTQPKEGDITNSEESYSKYFIE